MNPIEQINFVRVTVEYLHGEEVLLTSKELYPLTGEGHIAMTIRRPKVEGVSNA